MTRTDVEADQVGYMYDLPRFNVNLPLIGKTYLGPPKAADIWEAIGFTASMSSNNKRLTAARSALVEMAQDLTPKERQVLIDTLQSMNQSEESEWIVCRLWMVFINGVWNKCINMCGTNTNRGISISFLDGISILLELATIK